MKYLGVDYGTKKIGVAVSDETGAVAFPRAIIRNNKTAIKELAALVQKEGAKGIVIGESLTSEGRENEVMADVRRFAEALGDAAGLPVYFERESWSSVEARRPPAQAGFQAKLDARLASNRPSGRSRIREAAEVDDSAAALILQRYLDKMNPNKNND